MMAKAKTSRVERKRRETREKIMSAAERLMKTRPLDELTIAEITDAADVGHGTFYLHFKSKYETVVPIVHKHTLQWDEVVQERARGIEDPAEALAYSARQMARLMVTDPLWRWFVKHSGVPVDDMRGALGGFFRRDFERGVLSGRFQVPSPAIAMSYLFGGLVNAILAIFEMEETYDAIDQVIEMMLRIVGIPVDEARDLAHRPMADQDLVSSGV